MTRKFTSLTACIVAAAGMSLSAQALSNVKSDFNADGKSDVLYFNRANAAAYELQVFNSSVQLQGFVHTPSALNWNVAAIGTSYPNGFAAHGKADLFWQNLVTGVTYKMAMNGVGVDAANSKVVYTELNADWRLVMSGDFDRDGVADLLYRNITTGAIWLQTLNADGSLKNGKVIFTESNIDWKPVAIAPSSVSPTGNDIIFYNATNGMVYLLMLNADGSAVADAGATGAITKSRLIYTATSPNWTLVSADDFNADGNTDLLFWNKATGDVYVQLFDANYSPLPGSKIIHNAPIAKWEIVATGDYNGDGFTDILWRNIDGTDPLFGGLYTMFLNVDVNHVPVVNYTDSNIIYTDATGAWRPTGMSSLTLDPPVPAASNVSNPWALTPQSATQAMPILYVTQGDTLNFGTGTKSARVQGPTNTTSVTWTAYLSDNSGVALVGGNPIINSGTGVFSTNTIGNVVVVATSNADATKTAARYVSVVASPVVASLSAVSTVIPLGTGTALNYSIPSNQSGVLTADTVPAGGTALSVPLTGTSTWTPTAAQYPLGTTKYSLTVTNQAGKISTPGTVVVTVNTQNTTLDTTITVSTPVAGAVTENSVYLASVPDSPGATYTWTIVGGTFNGSTAGRQISFTANPWTNGGTVTLTCRKDLNGQYNVSNLAPLTIYKAPTTISSLTVKNLVGATLTTQPTYVTAGDINTQITIPYDATLTYTWTPAATSTTVNGANATYTFTPAASGTFAPSLVIANAAGTQTVPVTTSRQIVATPTVAITPLTGYVTPNNVDEQSVAVAAVATSTYAWTATYSPVVAETAVVTFTTPNNTSATPKFTVNGGATGGTVNLSCTVTNGAGKAVASPAPSVYTLAALPVVPNTFVAAASNVTVTATSHASVFNASTNATYGKKTYTWTSNNGTVIQDPAFPTDSSKVVFTPANEGPVVFTITEKNMAGYSSATNLVTPGTGAGSVTAVAKPVISSFTVPNSGKVTAGNATTLNFVFSGGNAVVIDSGVSSPATAIAAPKNLIANTTTDTMMLAVNAVSDKHTLTLRVTNAASDYVEATQVVDVAMLPVLNATPLVVNVYDPTANAGAGGWVPYTPATTYLYGTLFQLVPAYTASTNAGYEGQTSTILPGLIGGSVPGPLPTSINYVEPAQGNQDFYLSVTNRANTTVNAAKVTVKIAVITVDDVTGAATMTHGTNQTLGGGVVNNAIDTTQSYYVASSTGTATATFAGAVMTAGSGTGTLTIKSKSNADSTKVSVNGFVVTVN